MNAATRHDTDASLLSLITSPVSLGGDDITATATTVDTCWVAGVASALAVPTLIDAFAGYENDQLGNNTHLHITLDQSLEIVNKQCQLPPSVTRRLGHDMTSRSHQRPAPPSGAQRSAARFDQSVLRCKLPAKAGQLFKLISGGNRYPGSKAASQLLSNIRHRQLQSMKHSRRVHECHLSNCNRARLQAIRTKGANRIMQLGGGMGNSKVSDVSYQTYFCLRHGIPTGLSYNDHCFGCGKNVQNVPNHELGCVRGYGDEINARHNLIRNTIIAAMRQIGGFARCEPNPFNDTTKRPDIEWLIEGRRIFFDVSITHPLSSTIVAKAAHKQLAAAQERETTKNNKYTPLCKSINAEFIPLVFESFGGYGPEFNLFIRDLRSITQKTLTLTDGETIINDMLDQIAYHIIHLNGIIMKLASSPGT